MRTDKKKKDKKEREIDDFLAQFDVPDSDDSVDNVDTNKYLHEYADVKQEQTKDKLSADGALSSSSEHLIEQSNEAANKNKKYGLVEVTPPKPGCGLVPVGTTNETRDSEDNAKCDTNSAETTKSDDLSKPSNSASEEAVTENENIREEENDETQLLDSESTNKNRSVAASEFTEKDGEPEIPQNSDSTDKTEIDGIINGKDADSGSDVYPTDKPEAHDKTPLSAGAFDRIKDKMSSKAENRQAASLAGFLFNKENNNRKSDKGDMTLANKNNKKTKNTNKNLENKQKKFTVKKLIRNLLILGLAAAAVFFVYAFIVISAAPKIDPSKMYDFVAESSTIYDDDDDKVMDVYYTQNRKLIKYDDLNKNTINAFVALEDKTFWKHHGFNWTRIVGAVFQSLTGHGGISGTSTITQQLARNVYLPNIKSQRSIKRKIIEMYYAGKIERSLSKKEIITAYLNTIYLGFGCYGIDAASHTYFSKSPKELNVKESAALASLPQAPDSYALIQYADSDSVSQKNANIIMRKPDTYIANDISKDRRNTCLDLMLEQGYINKKLHDKVYDKPLIKFIKPSISSKTSAYTYFNEYMLDQVSSALQEKYNISSKEANRMIYTGGLNIYSTLDARAQRVITEEFNDSSNFPYLYGIYYDRSGNIISRSGTILMYDYNDLFDSKGRFTFASDEARINKDGSVTIIKDKRIKIYKVESAEKKDYSIEFPKTYTKDGGALYSYSGGYINIPAKFKSLDDNGNIIISADYFNTKNAAIRKNGKNVVITETGYTLPPKVVQPQAAMVIVGVGTGELKAMSGGRGATGERVLNRAVSVRQPGSSIKPLAVYGAALQKSCEYAKKDKKFTYVDYEHDRQGTKYFGDYLTASSVIIDEPMTFNGKQWPKNAGGGHVGAVTMRKGIQQSINTVAVKIQLQLGPEYSSNLLKKFGITTLDTQGSVNDLNPAAMALGGLTHGVKPVEMAQAYAAFPNGGVRQSTISYRKVTDRNGKTILTAKSKPTKVLDKGVAFIMTDMLKSVVSAGLGSPAATSGVQSGGKTGTTSEEYDIWFDGFTPTYAASLWIGCDVNIQLSTMSVTAARLWGRIMNRIPDALKGEYKEAPSNVIHVGNEYYTEGTESGRSNYMALMRQRREAARRREAEERRRREAEQRRKKPGGNGRNKKPQQQNSKKR